MSVQDEGRTGYLQMGIPVSGALDKLSYRTANSILDNPPGSPCIEIIQSGAKFRFHAKCSVAISGAATAIKINGKLHKPDTIINLEQKDQLEITNCGRGLCSYLGIAGDIQTEQVLGSASTYGIARLGGNQGRPLTKGDIITVKNLREMSEKKVPVRKHLTQAKSATVRILKGPEFDFMDAASKEKLITSPFKISMNSNRIGFRLEGPELRASAYDIESRPLVPGTIQLTSSGPILLMNDCQTTGGYPRIANVLTIDMPVCGQLAPGNSVRFRLKTLEEVLEQKTLSSI